jgi:NitT/TauT family transport system ATP-binding protein
MSVPAIQLHQVGKTYRNGTVALQGVDLTIRPSEFVSLVGPSGCGKSTVLRIIAGLGQQTSGWLEWGEDPSQQNLAFVFQEAALMPWATVMDNVHLPLKLMGRSRRQSRSDISEALQMVHLDGFERAYPRELSGGMKMRVSIARALVTKPHILLMDEPFGALDEMTRSNLNEELLRMWSEKQWTVMFVTHNIYEAVYLSNRVVVMAARPGRVVANIPIDEPYPRRDDFRTSPEFSHYCREISARLSEGAEPEANSYSMSTPHATR